jgi:hypothetical protein
MFLKPVILTPTGQLELSLKAAWLEINRLYARGNSKDPGDTEALKEAQAAIRRLTPVGSWPKELVESFIAVAIHIFNWTVAPIQSVELLLSFVPETQLSESCRLDLASLWLASQIAAKPNLEDSPAEILREAMSELGFLSVSADVLVPCLEAQVVLCLAESADRLAEEHLQWVRDACSRLTKSTHLRTELADAATRLGIQIPSVIVLPAGESEVSATSRERPPAPVNTPYILALPRTLSENDLQTAYASITFDLTAHASDSTTQLTPRTIEQIKRLEPDSPTADSDATLYFAGLEMWHWYVATGDTQLRDVVADIAEFLLSRFGKSERAERANALHLWVTANIGRKIRTSSFSELLNDASRLFGVVGIKQNDLWVRQMIVEAAAAECRALEADGDRESVTQFMAENWRDVSAIHDEYLAKAKAAHFEPRAEEQLAHDYLANLAGPPKRVEPGIRNSEDFQKIINRGSAEDIYEFAVARNDEIQRLLEARLSVRLGLDHVIEPDGEVYDPGSKAKGVLDPMFIEAKRALAQQDYQKAASLFERLSQRVRGLDSDIAKDYQGFALARLGVNMPARLPLQELCQDGFSRFSSYWNLACCILSEEMDQQLEVLAEGLTYAPDPRLLNGAIYVALYLNDPRLIDWLPCVTLTEALLLFYKLDHERDTLSSAARQTHVLRLARYALEGEPIMPDIADARVPDGEVQAYLNALLERKQPAAFDFWLKCRERRFKKRYKHWEIKADYLERTDRKAEAAKAFEEELHQRLHFFGVVQGKNKPLAHAIIKEAAPRLDRWLSACMTPDLKSIGFRLYNVARQFEKQYSHQNAVLLPTRPRTIKYYAADELPAPPDLEKLLVFVGSELQTRYRNLPDLPSVRGRLDALVDDLGRNGHRESADALRRLVNLLEGYGRLQQEAERRTALQTLHSTLAAVKGALQRELNEPQFTLAGPILDALKGVVESAARESKLLPALSIHPVMGDAVYVSRDTPTVIPIRVAVPPGQGVAKLVGATGIIAETSSELTLRDKLDEHEPVLVGPDQSAILTLESSAIAGDSNDREAKISVEFEYSGGRYGTSPTSITVRMGVARELPPSPYIYNRALEPNEIDTHFFGRTTEQNEILESIAKGMLRYVEGIQRTGKSSLLRSLQHMIEIRRLPLIPVYLSVGGISGVDHAGRVLFNIASEIATTVESSSTIELLSEERFCENLPGAYAHFERALATKAAGAKVVVLLDDFNQLIDAAVDAKQHRPALHASIIALLNTIRSHAKPSANILWVFAGHKTILQYKKDLPGPDLWSTLKPLTIDFLKVDAVGEIIRTPVGPALIAPDETIRRVHTLTAGHPELVQKIAELMLNDARSEKRCIVTPADADSATEFLALYSDDPFAGAWVPEAELRRDPTTLRLLIDFIRKVDVGSRTTLHALVSPSEVTEKQAAAIEDLKARKILHSFEDGLGVRARVLDLWLHHRMLKDVQWEQPGSPALFVDVANLTAGTGAATLTDLDTLAGDGIPGRFSLANVLDKIEKHVYRLTKLPIAAKWTVNYPARCPAVMECGSKGYQIDHIPDYLYEKARSHPGADDTVLMERIGSVEQQFPNVQHFFIVTGDKDYRIKVERLLERGKHVHFVSRRSSLGNPDAKHSYDTLAAMYPDRFTLKRLEDLLEAE